LNTPTHIPQEVLLEATAAEQALVAAKTFPVPTTAAEYQSAADQLRAIKTRAASLESWREKLKKPILEAGRAIDAFFKAPQQFLADAEKAIKTSMLTYDRRQQQLREEAERLAAEAARKEQERLQAQAAKAEAAARAKREEEERKAREKREIEEAKARKLEEAGRAEEADRRRAAAQEAEQRRMEAAAETERQRIAEADAKRLAAETMPTAPVIHMETQKVAGISTREVWSAEVTDKMKLIRAVAAGEAPAELLDINMSTLNRLAKALKGGLSYPGIRAVSEKNMAAARG
jgi:DNA repair exonuclease SbcCD ATPase subunit